MEIRLEDLQKLLLGRYMVKQNIGTGGMGSVYKVLCTEDNRVYAAKIIPEGGLCDGRSEAEILRSLHHPMLPEFREYVEGEGFVIIIMEFICGCTLKDLVEKSGVISKNSIVYMLRQLADVLLYLHNQSPPVIYRDLKPANIMVEGRDRLRLIDFGIARNYKRFSENDTVALGTPGYAAPEQLMGSNQSDVRTDIYALGATMYFAITGKDIGKPPFEMEPIHILRSGIDRYIAEIIEQCLQNNPQKRFQSITELLSALDVGGYPGKKGKIKNYKSINIMITHSSKNIMV